MLGEAMICAGSVVIILWGIGHIMPTGSIIKGFEPISPDNKRIITMEWIAEGLTFLFIGSLVISISILHGFRNPVCASVYRISALMLIVMAVLSLLTGARTPILPMKLCPAVKTTVAVLFFLGSVL